MIAGIVLIVASGLFVLGLTLRIRDNRQEARDRMWHTIERPERLPVQGLPVQGKKGSRYATGKLEIAVVRRWGKGDHVIGSYAIDDDDTYVRLREEAAITEARLNRTRDLP